MKVHHPHAAFALVLAVVLIGTGCGDRDELDFCTAYGDFAEQRATVQALDATSLNAEDAADVANDYLDSVQKLEQVADGRYAQQIGNLEAAAQDVVRTLESVDDQADYSTWAPLVEDDLDTASDLADQLDGAIGPSCGADTGS